MQKSTLLLVASLTTLFAVAAPSPVCKNANAPSYTKGPSGIFQVLQAHRQGKDIAVFWMMADPTLAVNSFTVFKTYEDPTDPYAVWMPVAAVNGQSPKAYRVTDRNVLPGYNSYRVAAFFADGSVEYSEVRAVRVVQH